MIVDNDLLSIQNARILAENASEAQKRLAELPQERLDALVAAMGRAVADEARDLAVLSQKESDCGVWQDKLAALQFVCGPVLESLLRMRCVGVLREDREQGLMDVGVPVGVIASLAPATSPVVTTAHQAFMAVKSGNAILFSPHPRAARSTARVVALMAEAAEAAGLPEGCLACLGPSARSGARELISHRAVSFIINAGVPTLLHETQLSGKPFIYAGTGQGPAFIERTADIAQAARDIVRSRTFDNGTAPGAEQCVVVDACVLAEVRDALKAAGCHFMTQEERRKLGMVLAACGCAGPGVLGMPAETLACRAGFSVPAGTRVLVALREYVDEHDPFSGEIMAPVLSLYVEADWRQACEKCIEVLLYEHKGHTLVIHSRDEAVIRQFALKKPVGRMLVNTPAVFGAMGMTTNLAPSVTLGSGSAGFGITSDNVTARHFTYIRRIGYGMRQPEQAGATASADTGLDAEAVRRMFGGGLQAFLGRHAGQ